MVRALVCGWFSFFHGEATAGDLATRDVVCSWLAQSGISHDVAESPVLGGGADLAGANDADYDVVVFVCGPLGGWQVERLAARFEKSRLIAVNVSRVGSAVEKYFDVIIARDGPPGSASGVADLALLWPSDMAKLPVVGVVRAPGQAEYTSGGHRDAHAAIDGLLGARTSTSLEIDTRIDPRLSNQRHIGQIEALLGSVDAVISTRLHGLVFALRQGVPAVAVDPVHGGAKVTAQARALDWPALVSVEDIRSNALGDSLDWCLTPEARQRASDCRRRGAEKASAIRKDLLHALSPGRPDPLSR